MFIGLYGDGQLTITDGAVVRNTRLSTTASSFGDVTIGANTGTDFRGNTGTGTGSVTVSGGLLESTSPLSVAGAGIGELTIEQGGRVLNTQGYVGFSTGLEGLVSLTGVGSEWASSESVVVWLRGYGITAAHAGSRLTASNAITIGAWGY